MLEPSYNPNSNAQFLNMQLIREVDHDDVGSSITRKSIKFIIGQVPVAFTTVNFLPCNDKSFNAAIPEFLLVVFMLEINYSYCIPKWKNALF